MNNQIKLGYYFWKQFYFRYIIIYRSAYYHGAVVALVSILPRGFLYKDTTVLIVTIVIITIIDKCTCMTNESSIEKAIR